RVVSSYSSSVKALLYTRQGKERKNTNEAVNEILLTSMPKTEGANDLIGADKEVESLERLLRAGPNAVTKLREPTKSAVMSHLRSCAVFHFAGHGTSDLQDPSESRLLLKDWKKDPLTVLDLIGLNLYERRPWLAYLSACSTGESQDDTLYDE